MKKKILIEGMTCGHCSGRVKKALEEMGGVTEVILDLQGKNAVLTSSGEVSDEQIREVIEDAGYDVIGIENL
jgi:copper chaperone